MLLKATNVFQRNWDELGKSRICVNQGGRGSSKTFSIAQLFLILLLTKKNTLLTVTRKTLPALRATAMRDFLEIMKSEGVYREERHNKSDLTYHYGSNEIEFISVDQPQKVRGRKRQYLWLNEANEFSYEDFRQLNMRTEKQIWMDFNPSDEFHWIYDNVLTRDDCALIKSTYKDNPFLDSTIVKEIERLKGLDPNYWRIYGEGERGISELKIYSHWQYCDDLPDGETIYGLDLGYNHPTALMEIRENEDNYYWDEKIHQSFLTTPDLIEKMNELKIDKSKNIYASPERPDDIKEIQKAGYNIRAARAEQGSVAKGIDIIKSHGFFITKRSVKTSKEIKSYSWREKDGKPLDEPVKINDDAMDAGRMAIYTHFLKPKVQIFL